MTTSLDQPLELPCGAELPNRIAKAATTEGLAEDGDPTDRLATLYGRWADGGAGLLVTGNAMVDRRFLERPGNVVVDEHTDRTGLRRWARAGRRNDNHLWLQLNHPGRQCSTDVTDQPVAPSAVRLETSDKFAEPRPLTDAEIRALIEAWATAASTGADTGFSGVQIHAAHGYLINQFLSPRTNRRTDRWGGDLADRARFLLRIVEAVRSAVGPDLPVAVKLNASDFQRGGFAIEDARRVAGWLADRDIDLLEISGGTYEQTAFVGDIPDNQSENDRPYFGRYARAVSEATSGLPLMITGGVRTRTAIEEGLKRGDFDAVGAARPLCADPDVPRRLVNQQTDRLPRPARRLEKARRSGTVGPGQTKAVEDWFYDQIERMARGDDPADLPG